MCTDFIDAVRACFANGGFKETDKGKESGGTFLVGYRGQIYEIDDDFQVGIPASGVCACGCGQDVALGAVAALLGQNIPPKEMIEKALEITQYFNAGVRQPFTVLEV
jgi:ATP-dependent protease HslVU (ClpYQ) peptidase subunit